MWTNGTDVDRLDGRGTDETDVDGRDGTGVDGRDGRGTDGWLERGRTWTDGAIHSMRELSRFILSYPIVYQTCPA